MVGQEIHILLAWVPNMYKIWYTFFTILYQSVLTLRSIFCGSDSGNGYSMPSVGGRDYGSSESEAYGS